MHDEDERDAVEQEAVLGELSEELGQADDDDGPEIVEYGDAQEKRFESRRDPRSEERENPECKSDIGGHRNPPAGNAASAEVQRHIQQGRNNHAAVKPAETMPMSSSSFSFMGSVCNCARAFSILR